MVIIINILITSSDYTVGVVMEASHFYIFYTTQCNSYHILSDNLAIVFLLNREKDWIFSFLLGFGF